VARGTAARDGNGGLAFYGTHTRAGELLVGVVLAYAVLSPAFRRVIETETGVKAVRYGGPAALVGLAWLWHATTLGDPKLFGGITALNALLTGWVILSVTTPGPATTALSSWPLRTLGRLSFAAYLIHWPIYLLIAPPRLDLDSHLLFVLRLAATLAGAAVLLFVIERPFRERLRMPRARLAAVLGSTTAVLAAAVIVLPVQPPPNVSLTIDDGSGPGDLDVVVPSGDEQASIALVGDSLAGALPPGIETWNAEHTDRQFRVHTHITDDCPMSAPGPVRLGGATIGEQTACVGWEPRLPELLDAADADAVVVVGGLGELGDRQIDRDWRHIGDPLYDAWLVDELDGLADTLASADVPVLWATYPHVRVPGDDGDWTSVPENDPQRVDRLNELIQRTVAGRDGFQVIDLVAAAQEFPRGGEFSADYRQDGVTLTQTGSDRVGAWLAGRVEEALDLTPAEPEGGDG
jgi:hypothetical protein